MEKGQKSPFQVSPKPAQPARFFSDAEESFIKNAFSGEDGERKLKILRKAFLPVYDADGSIGMAVDLWTGENYATMLPDQQVQAVLSRIHYINSVEKTLNMLKSVANRVDETPQEQAERIRKDSVK